MASSIPPSQPSSQDQSPLSSLNLDFLRPLTEKRTTRDGQPQKRRGPKPDSKPALTRRQELNRQAQRTHRERKELYIKALEDEVLRLKELFSNISQDKERLVEENRQLKGILAQNGLGVGSLTGASSVLDDSMSSPSVCYTSSASVEGSYVPVSSNTGALTSPPLSPHSATYSHSHRHQRSGPGHLSAGMGTAGQPNQNPNLDYDQAGIDFVLTLEKPCMKHMPLMLERATEAGGNEPCGHALMASCSPEPFPDLTPDIPFGYSSSSANPSNARHHHHHHQNQARGHDHGQRTWELSKGDLATLLDLSRRLNLDGEITPVMAWGMVLAHPRLAELRADDFVRLTDELSGKVRCYGFGAVMEEFEVRDALESIFSTKPEFVGIGY